MIFRPAHLGDFVCAIPTFRAFRQLVPSARISLIALPQTEPLVERSPWLDGFFPFPGYPGIAEHLFNPAESLQFLAAMQQERFDVAVQLFGSGVYSNPVTLMLGAKRTIGFVRPSDTRGLLDFSVPFPEEGRDVERWLALPRALGATNASAELELPLLPSDRDAAQRLLGGSGCPLIGVHLGASQPAKRAPPGRLTAAAASMARKLGGSVVLLGTEPPHELDLRQAAAAEVPLLDLTTRTEVTVAAAIIKELALLIGNDSGLVHIAYALRVPTVTVFLITDSARWGPPPHPRHRILNGLPTAAEFESAAMAALGATDGGAN